MSKPSVRRKDIELREEVEWSQTMDQSVREGVTVQWTATLEGHLSTGEYAEMYRHGATAAKSLAALTEAIEEQGWTVK